MPADDFRFLSGHFRVLHRRLTERLVGSDEWMTFETELWGYPVMNGAAFVDEMRGERDGREFWGLTLRVFDPTSDEWSLYWSDTWHPGLCPPTIGRFEGDSGRFYGTDRHESRPVHVQFSWLDTSTVPRWEQAYSIDGGESWETNWIMTFHRIGDSGQAAPERAF